MAVLTLFATDIHAYSTCSVAQHMTGSTNSSTTSVSTIVKRTCGERTVSCCVGLEQHRDMGLTIDRCTVCTALTAPQEEIWELLIACGKSGGKGRFRPSTSQPDTRDRQALARVRKQTNVRLHVSRVKLPQ